MVKLKRDFKCKGHTYFDPDIVYQTLTYLKSCNKFYDDISTAKGLSSEEMFKFSVIIEIQGQFGCVTKKNVSDEKGITENINDRSKTEFASLEDPLNIHRIASNETTLVSEILNIINDENVTTTPRQGKTTKKNSFNFKQ